jgi:uncharacterized protein (DUF1800 family)
MTRPIRANLGLLFSGLCFSGLCVLSSAVRAQEGPASSEPSGVEPRSIDLPIISSEGLTETQQIRHVLSRFAFGPTPGLVEEVRKVGLPQWFQKQLEGGIGSGYELTERLRGYETLGMSPKEYLQWIRDLAAKMPKERKPADNAKLNRARNKMRGELKDFVLWQAIYARHQLLETTSDFFRNHFSVESAKGAVRYYIADWEKNVIRKGALGSFPALLEATAKHPAMLVFLDNAVSRKPPTKGELNNLKARVRTRTGSKERATESVEIARQRGLNENYARELFELHTLGVDNFYKQRDVVELAKVLTGWTVDNNPGSATFGFRFREDMHVRGDKYVLGRRYRAASGESPIVEGEKIIEFLARHPGTAEFIAWKLCRWFVHDYPSDAMVKRIASVYKRTRGDLKAIYRAIFEDPEFFAPANYQAKFKRPFEFVVSAVRVTGAEVSSLVGIRRTLDALSEPLYECLDPTGFYDQAEAWKDPGVMAIRWKFAIDLARGRVPGIKIPDSFYADLHPRIPNAWKDQLARKILPVAMGDKTSRVIDKMIRGYREKNSRPQPKQLGPLIVGMLLGSPEFQRQ